MSTAQAKQLLRSETPPFGATPDAWEAFLDALSTSEDGRKRSFTETREGYGAFGILPKRLVDLKIAAAVRCKAGIALSAVFRPTRLAPTAALAERAFLMSPDAQRRVLLVSLALYDKNVLQANELLLPEGMTRSGALALLHRLGPRALEKWAAYQSPSTRALYERCNGLF